MNPAPIDSVFFSYLAHMPTQPCAPALYRSHPHTHVHARTCRREAAVNYVPHIQDVVQSFSYSSRHQRGFPTQGTAFKQPLTVARAAGRADMLTQWWSECTSLHAFVGTRGPKDAACFRVHADVCNCVWCASPSPIPLLILLPPPPFSLFRHTFIFFTGTGDQYSNCDGSQDQFQRGIAAVFAGRGAGHWQAAEGN